MMTTTPEDDERRAARGQLAQPRELRGEQHAVATGSVTCIADDDPFQHARDDTRGRGPLNRH